MKLMISIFSSLLIINCVSNGMEIIDDNSVLREKVLYDREILSHITGQLWTNRRCNTVYVGESIRSFSCVNKFFYRYYSPENNQQIITQNIVRNNYELDERAALLLHLDTITEKIKYFVNIAENKDGRFRQEDLQDRRYFNVTNVRKQPLVHIAIEHDNIIGAELIIDHLSSDITCKQLSELARVVYWKIKRTESTDLLSLLQNFHTELKKKIVILHRKAGI